MSTTGIFHAHRLCPGATQATVKAVLSGILPDEDPDDVADDWEDVDFASSSEPSWVYGDPDDEEEAEPQEGDFWPEPDDSDE